MAIYIYICFEDASINAGINMVYLASTGWYMWSRTVTTTRSCRSGATAPATDYARSSVLLIYVAVFLLLRWVNRDDAAYLTSWLPRIDAFNTSFFLVATILMAVKRLENWHFWIIGNIVSIPIYASQGLYFTSGQYAVFLVLAIMGLGRER